MAISSPFGKPCHLAARPTAWLAWGKWRPLIDPRPSIHVRESSLGSRPEVIICREYRKAHRTQSRPTHTTGLRHRPRNVRPVPADVARAVPAGGLHGCSLCWLLLRSGRDHQPQNRGERNGRSQSQSPAHCMAGAPSVQRAGPRPTPPDVMFASRTSSASTFNRVMTRDLSRFMKTDITSR
jgi:hypothetical protein